MCAYTAVPGGRTAYLSELRSGSEVVVADSQGRCHVAVVGRAKVERRPMVMVEVEVGTRQPRFSVYYSIYHCTSPVTAERKVRNYEGLCSVPVLLFSKIPISA